MKSMSDRFGHKNTNWRRAEYGGGDPVVLGLIVVGLIVYMVFTLWMDNMKADRAEVWGTRQQMYIDRHNREETIKRQMMFPRGVGYTAAQKMQ